MKIRNKGSKIINIGTTILMPDASMDINEATLKLPAIQAFIAKGPRQRPKLTRRPRLRRKLLPRRPQRIRPRLTLPRRPLPQRLPTRTSKE